MFVRGEIKGNEFFYTDEDYYRTQVIRLDYNYKF